MGQEYKEESKHHPVLDRRNKIIEETYVQTKRREYLQLNLLGDGEESYSSEMSGNNFFNVDVNLLTNEDRLLTQIPDYTIQYRLYFEN